MGNLIKNGSMELDSNWNDYGSPSVNERSSERVYRGAYSRKFIGKHDAGIKSDTFITVTGQKYDGEFWIYPVDCAVFNIFVQRGDDSTVSYGAYAISSGLTANIWNKHEFTYTETAGGPNAYLVLYKANTYYVDNVILSIPWPSAPPIRRCPYCKLIFAEDVRIYGGLCPKCKRKMPS